MMESRIIKVMGIVNINDDSYYSLSRAVKGDDFIKRTDKLIVEGADIIDIGACSTRPGAVMIDEETEWERLRPIVEIFRKRYTGVQLSVDTFRSEIVERVFEIAGRFMVNDISAGHEDCDMLEVVGRYNLQYVAMHRLGDCRTMHDNYGYDDITDDVIEYFKNFDKEAQLHNVSDYIIDPGFGFSKSIEDNYRLLANLSRLKCLNKPILVGISRKSMIYNSLGITPEESLCATSALHLQCLMEGADILRVHDVLQARQCIELYHRIRVK